MTSAQRILLLGWDPDLLQLLRDFLASSGYEVVEPASNDDARRLLADHDVDLVIAESQRLADSGLLRTLRPYPLLALVEMGAAALPMHSPRSRILTKPASLRAISEQLAELVAELQPRTAG